MKLLPAVCFVGLLPFLAAAQVPDTDAPPKPKPNVPVLAKDHMGLGRIGVRLDFPKDKGGLPVIVGMTRGGPLDDFGFKIGDVIIKIDKNYTNSLSEDEVRLALHGEPGTGVELTVQRGDDPRYIVRAVARRILTADQEDVLPGYGLPETNSDFQ
jgi:S1-C subfamily serine protease